MCAIKIVKVKKQQKKSSKISPKDRLPDFLPQFFKRWMSLPTQGMDFYPEDDKMGFPELSAGLWFIRWMALVKVN